MKQRERRLQLRGVRRKVRLTLDSLVVPGRKGPNRIIGWGVGIVAPILLLVMLSLTAYYPALTTTVGERDRVPSASG